MIKRRMFSEKVADGYFAECNGVRVTTHTVWNDGQVRLGQIRLGRFT